MSQNYDVIHFEALGEEANHLAEDTKAAQAKGELPADLRLVSESEWRTSEQGRFLVDGAPDGPVRYKFLRYERTSND